MTAPLLHVELEGPDLLAELTTIANAITPELASVAGQIGQAIEDAATGPTPVRTGRLLASIFWEVDSGLGVTVSPHVEYGEIVHRRIPYMLMAYQIAEPEIDRLLDRAGDRIIAEGG
jgi:hypothetical protein